ncbi:MAG: hypothetical protein CL844_03105 [Crocinitomicaceae bacterium]|nr:hypothetical protein [Crocinitomicaceae bacterium]
MKIEFEIEVKDLVIIYKIKGKITSDIDFEEIEKEVFKNINKNYFRIIFNLDELTHTNSMGISFFMRTLTKSRIMGGELILCNVRGNVDKIFKIAKLNEIYTIYNSQKEAIKHFN